MQNTIQGLYVTVIGMGLLFVSLGLLMGCIALLTRLFPVKDQEPGGDGDAATPDEPVEGAAAGTDAMNTRVAAIAVGLALAEQDHLPRIPRAAPPAGSNVADAWVILGRQAGMAAHRPR